MNALERAVVEAARTFVEHFVPSAADADAERFHVLDQAVEALDKAQADPERVIEIPWSQVCEGDRLKSIKNGKFYEVVSTVLNPLDDQFMVRLRTGEKLTIINRPTATEPTAFVKRGPAGNAVDVWVDVLSSGGK